MNNQSSMLQQVATFCLDKLWLILLLTPLVIIAILGIQKLFPAEHSSRAPQSLTVSVGAVEISAVELAAIVAKPLGELLTMEVYQMGTSLISENSIQQESRRTAYLSEIRPADDMLSRRAVYRLAKTNKIRKRKETS